MILALGTFSLLDTTAKYLSRYYPVPVIVWARYALNLALLGAFLIATRRTGVWRAKRPGIQLARGLLLATATLFFFTSLSVLPLAEASAIGFVMPLFVVALAVPMLGERLDMARLIAILVGLAGALVIVRPGSGVFTWYALLPIGMAICTALYQVLTRMVAGVDKPFTSLLYGSLVGAVALSLVVPFFWRSPQGLWHWSLILLMGLFATLGHLALIRAFDHAGASLLAPFTYTQLVWAILLGWIVFGNFPDGWSLAGMAIIVVAGLYVANRQRLAVRR